MRMTGFLCRLTGLYGWCVVGYFEGDKGDGGEIENGINESRKGYVGEKFSRTFSASSRPSYR